MDWTVSRSCLGAASWLVAALVLLPACGDDATEPGPPGGGGTAGTGATGGSGGSGGDGAGTTGGGGSGGGFDPDSAGINMMLMLGGIEMMSQPMEMAVAVFMPSAREDFEPDDGPAPIPMDTCVVQEETPTTPSCTNNEECAPEQQCLPSESDENGNPIPGTEKCLTPREPIDVGPLTVEGFSTGAIELDYNPGQSGAYTPPNSDGQVDPGTLAYDTTYTFQNAGSAEHELGALSGEVYMPAQFTLTSPPLVEMDMPGIYGFYIDASQDLTLLWSGPNPGGELRLSLSGGPNGGGTPIACRLTDDGEFTIPAAQLQAVGLTPIAFFNMLTIERYGVGSATADGLTVQDISVMQTLLLNVASAP